MIDFEGRKYVIIQKSSRGVVHLTDIAPTINRGTPTQAAVIISTGRRFEISSYEVVQNLKFKGDK